MNHVILGDCFQVLEQLEDNSIDLILTDPPYQISRNSNFTKNSSNKKYNKISLDFGNWDKDEIDLDKLFYEYNRVLRSKGSVIIFYDIWKSSNIKYHAEKYGFKQPRVCQWVKTNPVPVNSKINYLSNSIEFFFTFVKGKSPTFHSSYDKGIYEFPICHGRERTSHPTQKPLSLIKDILLKHSNENHTVLDCFGGSGTTAVACKELNRKYIIIEQDESYHELILNRLSE